jgi:hypothetical protein
MHENNKSSDCTSQVRDAIEANVRTCRRNGGQSQAKVRESRYKVTQV